jgi:hypothetical protein
MVHDLISDFSSTRREVSLGFGSRVSGPCSVRCWKRKADHFRLWCRKCNLDVLLWLVSAFFSRDMPSCFFLDGQHGHWAQITFGGNDFSVSVCYVLLIKSPKVLPDVHALWIKNTNSCYGWRKNRLPISVQRLFTELILYILPCEIPFRGLNMLLQHQRRQEQKITIFSVNILRERPYQEGPEYFRSSSKAPRPKWNGWCFDTQSMYSWQPLFSQNQSE